MSAGKKAYPVSKSITKLFAGVPIDMAPVYSVPSWSVSPTVPVLPAVFFGLAMYLGFDTARFSSARRLATGPAEGGGTPCSRPEPSPKTLSPRFAS